MLFRSTAKFIKEAQQQLGAMIRETFELDKSVDPLSLAVGSLFICKQCGYSKPWPDVLSHSCNHKSYVARDGDDEVYHKLVHWHLEGSKWRSVDYSVPKVLLGGIVALAGMDIKTTTIKEMDDSPVRFTCDRHNDRSSVKVFSWRTAVSEPYRMLC